MNNLVNVSEGAYLALHGLAYIAQRMPQRVNVKKLAEALHASEATLAKVFQKLSKSELVKSVRGPAGGFELNRPAAEINFLEIYEIIDGKIHLDGCPFGKHDCAFSKCIFNTHLNRISREIYDTFKNLRLDSFVS